MCLIFIAEYGLAAAYVFAQTRLHRCTHGRMSDLSSPAGNALTFAELPELMRFPE